MRQGDVDFANLTLMDLALFQLEFGDSAKAAATLKIRTGDGGDPGALAVLQAAMGDLAPARRFAANEESKDLKNTEIQFVNLPLLRARLVLADHRPADAIQLLEPARPYQLRDFNVPDLRAQTETEAGRLDAAAEDNRLILANQGVDPISPLYSLAHLRLARVLVLQKKTDEARQQYRAFLDAWKNADSDLPLLRAARSEFAKLQ
jgi:predicted negative regulator of RcsB-dependent stress response